MNKLKVEGKQLKALHLLNEEWSLDMKVCFLSKFLRSKFAVSLMVNLVGSYNVKENDIKANTLFEEALELIEEKYGDDLLLRMYLCQRYPDTFGVDDKDADEILYLARVFDEVLAETGYIEKFKYPKKNFISKSKLHPVTSVLIAKGFHEYSWSSDFSTFKEFGLELYSDMPDLLFATSYKRIFVNIMEDSYQKEVVSRNELSKVKAVVDKQKEDIQKLKKANTEVKKEVTEEFELKMKKITDENRILSNKIDELEKDKQQLRRDVSKLSQERDSYKINWNKEVEKNANYEVMKLNLIKEKEEFQKLKQEYAELRKLQQYQYTERDWISGIFSIFMNNKEEIVKMYRESLTIMNDELNKYFNKTQPSISDKATHHENENPANSVVETQKVRVTKRKIGYLELIENEWYVDGVKVQALNPQQVLAENVFVLIDEHNNILYQLNAELNPERNYIGKKTKYMFYCSHKNGKFLDADGLEVKPIFKYPNKPIKEQQVLLLNEKNEVLIVFPMAQLNASKVMPFVKMNGLEIAVVKNKIDGFIIATDVITQMDKMFKFDNLSDFQNRIEIEATIISKENKIHSVFGSPLFYKMSDYFADKETAIVVEIVNDDYFVEKVNGEIVKIQKKYIGYKIKIDDVVIIDKNNNFLYKDFYAEIEFDEKKPLNLRKKLKSYKEKADISVMGKVLIIGNPSYKHSYELGMRRNGVSAEVIDGYSSYYSIKKRINEFDKVVVIPNFVSHENMFKIKEEFSSKDVFYPEKDGVNYIYQTIFG